MQRRGSRRDVESLLRSLGYGQPSSAVRMGATPDAPAQLSGMDLQAYIGQLEQKMRDAAANLEFEDAARIRDEIADLRRELREVG